MSKHHITLSLYALQPSDTTRLNQLLGGLRFKEPVQVHSQDPLRADIVLVDGDQPESHSFTLHNTDHREVIILCSHMKANPEGLLLEKPIRARQLLNCINSIIERLH